MGTLLVTRSNGEQAKRHVLTLISSVFGIDVLSLSDPIEVTLQVLLDHLSLPELLKVTFGPCLFPLFRELSAWRRRKKKKIINTKKNLVSNCSFQVISLNRRLNIKKLDYEEEIWVVVNKQAPQTTDMNLCKRMVRVGIVQNFEWMELYQLEKLIGIYLKPVTISQ